MKRASAFVLISLLLSGCASYVSVESVATVTSGIPSSEPSASDQLPVESSSSPGVSEEIHTDSVSEPVITVETKVPTPSPSVAEEESGPATSDSPALPSASPEPETSVALTSFVDDISKCRIPEDVFTGPHAKGFPITKNSVPYTGTVNVAVVPVDFDNAPGGSRETLKKYIDSLNNAVAWSKFVSGGKMTYNFITHDDWIRAPKGAEWYTCGQCGGVELQSRSEAFKQLTQAADEYYNFQQVDFVFFLVPPEARYKYNTEVYGNLSGYTTGDGSFEKRVFTNRLTDTVSQLWPLVVHEVLHDQGFIGHGPANGSNYGVMMNQWGKSKAILSWHSFLAGYMNQDDIVCIDARDGIDEYNILINSLDSLGASGGIKSVMIRRSHTAATIIEYRTSGPFSSLTEAEWGMTVYNLDVAKPSNRCDSCGPQQPQDEKNWWNYVRVPNHFDQYSNSNLNFKKLGTITTINNIKIDLIDKNIINISVAG